MQIALPHFKARAGGRIVNFYSIDADAAAWMHADYNISKSAILALSRLAAAEWGRFNILTNIIAPAAAGTVFEALERDNPGFAAMAAKANPLGRVGDPETGIAPVAVFLASDMARLVNGQLINVDGGQHLPRYDSRPADIGALERAGTKFGEVTIGGQGELFRSRKQACRWNAGSRTGGLCRC